MFKFSLNLFLITLITVFSFQQHQLFSQDVNKTHEVVIIGGGPAGYTAALYASRAGLDTLLIEGSEPGGQIALSYVVENYPGFPEGISGQALATNMRSQAEKYGTAYHVGHVTAVDLSQRPFKIELDDSEALYAQSLIIATGAQAKWLGLPSEQALIGNGVSSCAICDGALYKNREVVVVGGGEVALEDALFIAKYTSKVTLIHRRDTLKASKVLQEKAFANPKIEFVWDSVVEAIDDPAKETVSGVTIRNLKTGTTSYIPCSGVFVAIGHQPNTSLFEGQLELASGYITVKPFSTKTDIEGVFAAGDVVDDKYRQAITAAGTGAMAGIDAYNFLLNQ